MVKDSESKLISRRALLQGGVLFAGTALVSRWTPESPEQFLTIVYNTL